MTRSWIESAEAPECGFSLENLPYGAFVARGGPARCGVAIGDLALDLARIEAAGLLDAGGPGPVFAEPALNAFMALGREAWARVRERLRELLAEDGDPALRDDRELRAEALIPLVEINSRLPFDVSGYTDFNASRQHAFNAGSMFRGPDKALPENWLHMPVAYNGRASTVVVSGTPIRRPLGQMRGEDGAGPVFGPSRRLDFELELGAVVGLPTRMGEPVSVEEAETLIFGYVLMNDWSARDIQRWETQPLGPFLGKVFGTTIAPWVVTAAALEPARVDGPPRDTPLLPYLRGPEPALYDIALEARLKPAGSPEVTMIARTNYRHMYYSSAQQLAHHAVGGCAMRTGDLLGSGTISGPDRESWGSLLELTWNGRDPLTLDGGALRTFLQDGDEVIIRGHAEASGRQIGFGECRGVILPAPSPAWLRDG